MIKNEELLTLQRSGWILLSFMFLQTSIIAFQLMFSTRIFAHEMHIKASKVSNFKLVRRWLLIRFCLEKTLSHIAVLTGITITVLHKLLKPCQLIGHSGVVHANSQASNKDLFEITSLMVFTIFEHSPDTDLVLLQKFGTSQTTSPTILQYYEFSHHHLQGRDWD